MKKIILQILVCFLCVTSIRAEQTPVAEDVAAYLDSLRQKLEDIRVRYEVRKNTTESLGEVATQVRDYDFTGKRDKFKYTVNYLNPQNVKIGQQQAVWDGGYYKVQNNPTTAYIYPSLNTADMATFGNPMENAGISFAPKSADGAPATLGDMVGLLEAGLGSFASARKMCAGVDCLVWEVKDRLGPRVLRYYLDESRSFVLVGYESYDNDVLVFRLENKEFKEILDGLWLPTLSVRNYFEREGANIGKPRYDLVSVVKDMEINSGVDDNEFTLQLEDGVTVVDKVLGAQFVIRDGVPVPQETPKKKDVGSKDVIAASAALSEPATVGNGGSDTTPSVEEKSPRVHSLDPFLLVILVLLIVISFLVALARFRSHYSRQTSSRVER